MSRNVVETCGVAKEMEPLADIILLQNRQAGRRKILLQSVKNVSMKAAKDMSTKKN